MNTRNFLAELKRRHVYSEQFHTRAAEMFIAKRGAH